MRKTSCSVSFKNLVIFGHPPPEITTLPFCRCRYLVRICHQTCEKMVHVLQQHFNRSKSSSMKQLFIQLFFPLMQYKSLKLDGYIQLVSNIYSRFQKKKTIKKSMGPDHLSDQYRSSHYQLFKVQNIALVQKPLGLHIYTFNLFFLSDVHK